MNCLVYALRFWEKSPWYRLWYNGDHVINIPVEIKDPFPGKQFLPAEEYGYAYFAKWEHALVEESDRELLRKYFGVTLLTK